MSLTLYKIIVSKFEKQIENCYFNFFLNVIFMDNEI